MNNINALIKTKVRCRAFHIHHLLKDEPASPPEKEVSILELNELLMTNIIHLVRNQLMYSYQSLPKAK